MTSSTSSNATDSGSTDSGSTGSGTTDGGSANSSGSAATQLASTEIPAVQGVIEVSAVVIRNAAGHVLNVRKRGTSMLMLPGGKPEPGEDPRDTAIREFQEELGVSLDPLRLRGLGNFRAPAANEAGFEVLAHVYDHPYVEIGGPQAEIEHMEWSDPLAPAHNMAPLNVEQVFPALAAVDAGQRAPLRLAVYTGSAAGRSPRFAEAADAFGTALAEAGIGLVYGGGKVGLMGVLADAVIASGGETTGVITEALVMGELGHQGLTRLEVVPTMRERKSRMAGLSDGFVAMPGGPGTLEELFEVWTWMTLGILPKPVALFDVDGYWQPLIAAIDGMVDAGFATEAARDSLIVATDPAELFEKLTAWRAPKPKWEK